MRKKRLFGLLLLLFIIGLSYYLSSNQFILNQLKEVIISSVNEQLRGEITIEGIKGNLLKQIVLENLRVQEPSKEEVLRVQRIRVRYSLLYFIYLFYIPETLPVPG